MSQTEVIHVRQMKPGDIYIGRSCCGYKDSGWGNPFKVGRDGTVEEVVEIYRKWVRQQPQLLARLGELKGQRLACWCKPRICHGDVLAELAQNQPGKAEEEANEQQGLIERDTWTSEHNRLRAELFRLEEQINKYRQLLELAHLELAEVKEGIEQLFTPQQKACTYEVLHEWQAKYFERGS